MQPYQTFYPQMNNNYQMPMQSPYMDRMAQLQQYQQSLQQPVVPTQMSGANQFNPFGKLVESMDIVKVTDIPMDGNMYFFPQADGQAIYGKKFLPNGQTQILTFKPILDDNSNTLSQNEEKFDFGVFNELTDIFKEQLNSLTDKIDKIEKYLKPTKTKKEVDTDA